jgi:fatty-acyl-CoA synthase
MPLTLINGYNVGAVNPSYIHGPSETPLLGETIGQCLGRMTARFADNEALVSCHQGRRYTYRELHREVEVIARGMMSLGIERADRVGVWSPNCAEWLVAQYALAKIGAIMVNINPAYRPRELEHALGQSGVSVLISARGFRSVSY